MNGSKWGSHTVDCYLLWFESEEVSIPWLDTCSPDIVEPFRHLPGWQIQNQRDRNWGLKSASSGLIPLLHDPWKCRKPCCKLLEPWREPALPAIIMDHSHSKHESKWILLPLRLLDTPSVTRRVTQDMGIKSVITIVIILWLIGLWN